MNVGHESSPRAARWLEGLLIAVSIGAAGWLAFVMRDAHAGLGWVVFWCLGVAALGATARWPAMPLWVFAVFAYGVPRSAQGTGSRGQAQGAAARFADDYSAAFFDLMRYHVLTWVCVVGLLGVIVWLIRTHRRPPLRSWLVVLLSVFVVWIGISCVVAVSAGRPWEPIPHRHPIAFLHAMVVCFIAACVLTDRRRSVVTVGVFVAAVCVRALVSGKAGVHLDADTPALAVMLIPLAHLGVSTARIPLVRTASGLGATLLILPLFWSLNRGAMVGFIAMLPVFGMVSKQKKRWLLVGLPVILIGLVLLASSEYGRRFADTFKEGTDANATVQERLDIWQAGVRMANAHPLFGVGPGKFHKHVAEFSPTDPKTGEPTLRDGLVAHNNVVHVLGEAGYVGALLYITLFAATFVVLFKTARKHGHTWPGTAARMIAVALVAHFATGMFISRHDLVLVYVLVGWAVGVSRTPLRS